MVSRMKKVFAFIGTSLIVAALGVSVRSHFLEKTTASHYTTSPNDAAAAAGTSDPGDQPCHLEFLPIERVQQVGQSFTIVAVVRPTEGEGCEIAVEAYASAFKVEPKQFSRSEARGPRARKLHFNVLPKEPGKQELSFGNASETYTFEIEVRQYPFVPAKISFWFPMLGGVFGGMLTIPWWLERVRKKKPLNDGI